MKKTSFLTSQYHDLSLDDKKKLAKQYFLEGKEKLKQNDLTGLDLLDFASALDEKNPSFWFSLGSLYFEHGSTNRTKKTLLLAKRSLKIATTLDPQNFDAWHLWGLVYLQLSFFDNEHSRLLQAKDKIQKALSLSFNQDKAKLAKAYQDFGLIWLNLGKFSGEAVDIRTSIQSFRSSLAHNSKPSAIFWFYFGSSYSKMASLINDNRLFLKAIDYFKKGLFLSEKKEKLLFSLAKAYTQLYINTLNEDYFTQANHFYQQASLLQPTNSSLWLQWAQILSENGKINKNSQKLLQSIEKCIQGYRYNNKNPEILGQWVESLSYLGSISNRLDYLNDAKNKISKAVEDTPEISELWYAYGICLSSFSHYYNDLNYEEEAIEKFQIGLSIDRTCAELWQALAKTHQRIGIELEDIEYLERACKFYLKAIDFKPACPSITFDYACTLLKIAEITNSKKHIEDAIWQLELTIQSQKNNLLNHPEWLFYYAQALDLLGKNDDSEENHHIKSVEIFYQVLLIDPSYPKIYYSLALALSHAADFSENLKWYEKAINYFRLAAKQNPEDELVYLEWGITLISIAQITHTYAVQKHLYLDAERKLNKAGLLGNQHSYYFLACLYSLLHNYNKSIHFLSKAHLSGILPDIEELMLDEWLEPLHQIEQFTEFIQQLESKHDFSDEK